MGERTPAMRVASREEGDNSHRVGFWGKNTLKKSTGKGWRPTHYRRPRAWGRTHWRRCEGRLGPAKGQNPHACCPGEERAIEEEGEKGCAWRGSKRDGAVGPSYK